MGGIAFRMIYYHWFFSIWTMCKWMNLIQRSQLYVCLRILTHLCGNVCQLVSPLYWFSARAEIVQSYLVLSVESKHWDGARKTFNTLAEMVEQSTRLRMTTCQFILILTVLQPIHNMETEHGAAFTDPIISSFYSIQHSKLSYLSLDELFHTSFFFY